jgi:hypothetical protein
MGKSKHDHAQMKSPEAGEEEDNPVMPQVGGRSQRIVTISHRKPLLNLWIPGPDLATSLPGSLLR